jgi:hypothetical protein
MMAMSFSKDIREIGLSAAAFNIAQAPLGAHSR